MVFKLQWVVVAKRPMINVIRLRNTDGYTKHTFLILLLTMTASLFGDDYSPTIKNLMDKLILIWWQRIRVFVYFLD